MNNTTALSGPIHTPASGGKPQQLVIFLHGLGADGNDLISLAPMFAEALPDAQFISPNAPYPCDMAPYGRQWFSLVSWNPMDIYRGIRNATPILDAFISQQLAALKLDESKLALVGFSQGTMMALDVALRRSKPCAGVVGFSGALSGPEHLASEIKARPPVCLIHGNTDMVVPYSALGFATTALHALDVPVEAHTRPGLGHGIDPEGIGIAAGFLKKHLL